MTAAALAPPTEVAAQGAGAIMEQARAAYERRMADIEAYSVTHQVAGFPSTVEYRRMETAEGLVFVPQLPVDDAGVPAQTVDPGSVFRADFADRLRIAGTREVAGRACTDLEVTDFEGLDLEGGLGAGREGFAPRRMALCVDTDDFLVHRIWMEGAITGPAGEPTDLTTEVILTEYENVEGLMHPYIIEVRTTGLGEALAGSISGEAAAGAQLPPDIQRRLDELPEDQRRMLEQLMGRDDSALTSLAEAAAGNILIETLRVEVTKR
jgi:hypothetical protein